MKRLGCLMLALLLLLFSPALAEYEQYKLTVEDPSTVDFWEVFPLDAHNVILKARNPNGGQWHVGWYRDGELIRELRPAGSFDNYSRTTPDPVVGQDGLAGVLCYVQDGIQQFDSEGIPVGPNAVAQWTDNGLEDITLLTERVQGSPADNRMILYGSEDCVRVWHNGKDRLITGDLNTELHDGYSNATLLGDDVFLFRVIHWDEGEAYYICVDHGKERYRVPMVSAGLLCQADGRGGFLFQEYTDRQKYDPVRLYHFDENGLQDRVFQLQGNRVVVTMDRMYADPDTGLLTLYGSAMANSRQIYNVFAITLDSDWNTVALDVRKIDAAYKAYDASVSVSPDGSPWVLIYNPRDPEKITPALVPFSQLEQNSSDLGLSLR